MVRNYNPSSGTDRRRTQQLLLSPKMSYSIVGKVSRLAWQQQTAAWKPGLNYLLHIAGDFCAHLIHEKLSKLQSPRLLGQRSTTWLWMRLFPGNPEAAELFRENLLKISFKEKLLCKALLFLCFEILLLLDINLGKFCSTDPAGLRLTARNSSTLWP